LLSLTAWIRARQSAYAVRGLFLPLTSRTIVGRAASQADALDGPPAIRTRFAGAAVDAEFLLILSLQAGAANVIADAGAALLDGPGEDFDDRIVQAPRLGGAEVAATAGRMQAGLEERLVGVDVADAGDHALVEEHRVQTALRYPQL